MNTTLEILKDAQSEMRKLRKGNPSQFSYALRKASQVKTNPTWLKNQIIALHDLAISFNLSGDKVLTKSINDVLTTIINSIK